MYKCILYTIITAMEEGKKMGVPVKTFQLA